ncbi:MAG TPA: peptidoglycan DD-metalloendopeptidase family protein [Gemmatimonadales bacterium]|nr:peptidoglycan DD-metalloendopeptidase family protein [Gemmatimonadales bacterium]
MARSRHRRSPCHSAFRVPHSALLAGLTLFWLPQLSSAQALPPLPDTTGFGVHVLALARAPDGAIWVGTYGQGIFVFRPGAGSWEQLRHSGDTTVRSISWDFVHAFGFGPGGAIWYGTVGNGWGRSSDGGKTWTNWEFRQLGPQWQYVAPNGIVTRGDTVYIGTADGIKLSWDQGASWAEITDSAGATTAQNGWGRLRNQYVLALAAGPDGSLWASHLRGLARSRDGGRTWTEFPAPVRCADPECGNRVRALAPDDGGVVWAGTERGLYRLDPARNAWLDKRARPACAVAPLVKGCRVDMPAVQALHRAGAGHAYAATGEGIYDQDGHPLSRCDAVAAATSFLPLAPGWYAAGRPSSGLSSCRLDQGLSLVGVSYGQRPDSVFEGKRHTWFTRPIALADQPYIDQTYRYGSTMGGNFQQHQGVEFNNPNGTPVHAIGEGVVVFAGAAEQGAHTVAIRHDRRLGSLFIYSVYYHNTALRVFAGQRVKAGDVIATVGNTGRATNDHLHLEVHAAPVDSVPLVVDPNERYPKYTVNPELWIEPLPGTGIVAGQVWDPRGRPVPQARVYGLIKAEPQETPFSFAETYGERNHPDPAYREHFAVSDVEPGEYTLAVLVDGKRLSQRIRVEAGRVTWVVFGSGAH